MENETKPILAVIAHVYDAPGYEADKPTGNCRAIITEVGSDYLEVIALPNRKDCFSCVHNRYCFARKGRRARASA